MMKKKAKITAAVSAASISLMLITLHNQPPKEPLIPDTSSVSASLELGSDNTPAAENKAVVGGQIAKTSTQKSPQNDTPTETDFELPNPADSKAVLTESNAPMDNPPPTPAPSNNATAAKAAGPKMGDTRTVDGQKQVYFLGFGWIAYNEEPNQCVYAEDMYENGNKIGSMGGGTFVDGEGDINKMVGRMD